MKFQRGMQNIQLMAFCGLMNAVNGHFIGKDCQQWSFIQGTKRLSKFEIGTKWSDN